MNKKIVMLSAVVLLVLSAMMPALPVIADPTKGQMVPITSIFTLPPETQPGESRSTGGGIDLFEGRVQIYHNSFLLIGDDPPLTMCVYQVGRGSWHTKTEVVVYHWDVVFYVPAEGSPDGFSGNSELRLYGVDPVTRLWDSQSYHSVLHGFGAFEGQTLMLSYDGPINVVSTGYCLKG